MIVPTASGPHATTCAHQINASVGGARSARRQQCRLALQKFGLDEQILKCGMGAVRVGGREHDLRIAGQLDLLRLQRPVRQDHAAHFCCIVRRNGDLGHRVHVAVAANERDAIAGEENAVPLGLGSRRLVRRRPDMSGAQILDVAPLSVVVARRVVAPPRDREIPVPTEPAACIRDQRRIRDVPENADDRLRRVRRLDLAHGRLLHLARHACRVVALDVVHREAPRNSLLQHQLGRPHERVQVEAARPYLSIERVVERNDAHSNVVSHEGADDRLP